EDGDSFQALLTVGALPETVTFPGRQAELLFAPIEALRFPVDAAVSARWLPNSEAIALARRKVVDADNVFGEESHGDHGPSARTVERPAAARELEEYLTSSERPPLLRATISLAVDPKGDHRLDALVGVDHVEHIELRPGPRDRGLLDPFRIASEDTRADLAYSFLIDVLPAPVPPAWQTEIRDAVDTVAALGARTCGEILATLERGAEAATEAARALRVHARSGLRQ